MAKKMADDIIRAEKDGDKIITDAELKSREIIDQAKTKAKAQSEKLKAEATLKADSIIEQAKADTEKEKQIAEKSCEEICNDLKGKLEQNRKEAIDTAVSLLIS